MDIGTHGSGIALCTLENYKSGQNRILVKSWNSGSTITEKAPTSVLMSPNGKDFISFGYDAESEFFDLDPVEQKKHYLFRKFKMQLFNNKVSII